MKITIEVLSVFPEVCGTLSRCLSIRCIYWLCTSNLYPPVVLKEEKVLEHISELPAVDSMEEGLVLKTICGEEPPSRACSTLPLFYIRCYSIAIIKTRFKDLEETAPRTSCSCFKRSYSFHQRKVVFLNLEQTSSRA